MQEVYFVAKMRSAFLEAATLEEHLVAKMINAFLEATTLEGHLVAYGYLFSTMMKLNAVYSRLLNRMQKILKWYDSDSDRPA